MQGMQSVAPAPNANRSNANAATKNTSAADRENEAFESVLNDSIPEDQNVESTENAEEATPTESPEESAATVIACEATPLPIVFTVAPETPSTPLENSENSSAEGEKNSNSNGNVEVPFATNSSQLDCESSLESTQNLSLTPSEGKVSLNQTSNTNLPLDSYSDLTSFQALGTDHAGEKITVTQEMIHQAGPQFWELSGSSWDPNVSPLKLATQQAPGESLQLSSTHRLQDVVDSVFEERPLPTPRRIEIHLQTPEGAKVSLYLARVQGELRAQFSANSAQSFAWLQQEIHQLRGVDLGQVVRWLPPQLDKPTPLKTDAGEFASDPESNEEKKEDRGFDNLFKLFKTPTRRLA